MFLIRRERFLFLFLLFESLIEGEDIVLFLLELNENIFGEEF